MRKLFLLTSIAILIFSATPSPSQAEVSVAVGIGVNIGPPPLPVYVQPPAPAPGYIWTPGYWAWGPGGYYWVPGTWVAPPAVGLYWTPGYWSYDDGMYAWSPGYWAPTVGFYGGINYGYGYFGTDYVGGYWHNGAFFYNTAVTNVDPVFVQNIYIDRTVIVHDDDRVCYRGGPGGVRAWPLASQIEARRFERTDPPTAAQLQHERFAGMNRNSLATVNGGRPAVSAVDRPLTRASHAGAFAPIQHQDRVMAARHMMHSQALSSHTARLSPQTQHGARSFTASSSHTQRHVTSGTTTSRAPSNHAQIHRAQPNHAQTSHAPAYHAQTYHAPTNHAQSYHAQTSHAPAYHAQTYHAQTYHAPAYHAQSYHAQSSGSAGSARAPKSGPASGKGGLNGGKHSH